MLIFKKLVLHIDMGDIVWISSSTLAIWFWDYIKKVFQALVFILKKDIVFFTSVFAEGTANLVPDKFFPSTFL